MRKAIDGINGVLISLMFLTIFFQIFGRIILDVPTSWTVEIGIILFVCVVFLGQGPISREKGHLKVDALYQLFPPWLKRIMDIVCSLLYLALFGVFALGAYRNLRSNWDVGIPTIEWFKWGYVYLVVLIGTLANLAYLAVNLIEDILGTGGKA